MQLKFKLLGLSLVGGQLLLGWGCSSYPEKLAKLNAEWNQGLIQQAEDDAKLLVKDQTCDSDGKLKDAEKWDGDAVLLLLEQASIQRAAGKYADSNATLTLAIDKMAAFDEKAEVSVSTEAGSLLVNQTVVPYRGYGYDRIMASTYRGLNYLNLGEFSKARAAFAAAEDKQKELLEKYKSRVEKIQAEANKEKTKHGSMYGNVEMMTSNDPQYNSQKAKMEQELDAQIAKMPGLGNYRNAFTMYLQALTLAANPTSGSDISNAAAKLKLVQNMVGTNPYLKEDMTAVEQAMQGAAMPAATYVIFETGLAPKRNELQLHIPIPDGRGGTARFDAAFPFLMYDPNYLPQLTVRANNVEYRSALITSMDSVVAREFKNELPVIITKTLISASMKAAAQIAANHQDGWGGVALQVTTSVYSFVTAHADLRTWNTLPKEFHVCRVPTPADRTLNLVTPLGQTIPLKVQDGTINLVLVKSITPVAPMIISQVRLK